MKNPNQTQLFSEPVLLGKSSSRSVYCYLPKQLGNYDRYEVVSAFRKSVKLGETEDSFYWLTVMLKYGGRGARGYILRQCWIMCNEDAFDFDMVSYCAGIILAEKEFYLNETDMFYQLTWRLCRVNKWWESGEGREWDDAWAVAEGQVKQQSKQIPIYALDLHTNVGKEIYKDGCPISDQFSGTEIGRAKTRYIYERDKELNKNADIDDGFWNVWKAYQEKLGKRKLGK